jgi:CDGSH iron-sulfur domain-containing protein 3
MKITALENGPYVVDPEGQTITVEKNGVRETLDAPKVVLCRCGQSSNKPFCDGTHKAAEFGEPGSEIVFG